KNRSLPGKCLLIPLLFRASFHMICQSFHVFDRARQLSVCPTRRPFFSSLLEPWLQGCHFYKSSFPRVRLSQPVRLPLRGQTARKGMLHSRSRKQFHYCLHASFSMLQTHDR